MQTDKLGRWVQDGFLDGVEYVATVSAPGITFSPAQAPLDTNHHQLLAEGTTVTFAASGVARVPALLNEPGKPPGIRGVQVSFLQFAGRADIPIPPPVITETDGTWQQYGFQAFACDEPAANIAGNPGAGLQYTASTFLCVPHSLSEPGRSALGAQAGGRMLADTLRAGGLTHTVRVAHTPMHAVYAAHPEEP